MSKKLTVAKALQLKNFLSSEIKSRMEQFRKANTLNLSGETTGKVTRSEYISYEDYERAWNILTELHDMQAELCKLKARLDDVQHEEIRRKVYDLSELKSTLSFLEKLPFTNEKGEYEKGLGRNIHLSSIPSDEAEDVKLKLKNRVQNLQDELDHFNHTEHIVIGLDEFPVLSGLLGWDKEEQSQ